MMIRTLICFLLLVSTAQAQPTKLELIERLFDVTNMEEMTDKSADAIFSTLKTPPNAPACYREAEPEIIVMVKEATSFEETKPFLSKLYTDVFSEEELQQMIAFYTSPTGQKTLTKMPELMQKSMLHSQEVLKKLMPEIQETIRDNCGDE